MVGKPLQLLPVQMSGVQKAVVLFPGLGSSSIYCISILSCMLNVLTSS